eukprot:jgi/Chlat1/8885/Chrsp92S00687
MASVAAFAAGVAGRLEKNGLRVVAVRAYKRMDRKRTILQRAPNHHSCIIRLNTAKRNGGNAALTKETSVAMASSASAAKTQDASSEEHEQEEEEEEKEGDAAAPAGEEELQETAGEGADEEAKSTKYTRVMQKRMGGSMTYDHAAGINYARVLPDLIVGSCPQQPEDIDMLVEEEDVRVIFCLQEDSDLAYFNLDIGAIRARAEERGDVIHHRHPVRDFDPVSLRRNLPAAVASLYALHSLTGGTAYVHCTAGLGRAPATALAYMNWLRGLSLAQSNELLQAVRPCNPRYEAIRRATADVLSGLDADEEEVTLAWRRGGNRVQVAGLDVGWGQRIDAEKEVGRGTMRWVVRRPLRTGRYEYKYVIEGDRWTYNPDALTTAPDGGGNVNNVIDIPPRDPAAAATLARVLREDAVLTEEDYEQIKKVLESLKPDLSMYAKTFAVAK